MLENDKTENWNARARGLAATVSVPVSHSTFQTRLPSAFSKAKKAWANTYAATNANEYFAEGVQSWFNVNGEADPADGIHNHVNTRAELASFDKVLHDLIAQYLPADVNKCSCH